MAIIRQIAQLGHPVLRQETLPVEIISDPGVQNLLDDLLETVKDYNGVGIAANQVYESLKIFIIASHPNSRYPFAPLQPPIAMINPVIMSHSEEIIQGWEGCLSIPGIRGLVPRYSSVTVRYYNREGKEENTELTDFIARIFQHEYDHINGLVYLDRVDTNKNIITEKEYEKMFK